MTTNLPAKTITTDSLNGLPPWLEAVRKQVDSLRFGQVQIVVHDARVVQIERVEKFRIEAKPPGIH